RRRGRPRPGRKETLPAHPGSWMAKVQRGPSQAAGNSRPARRPCHWGLCDGERIAQGPKSDGKRHGEKIEAKDEHGRGLHLHTFSETRAACPRSAVGTGRRPGAGVAAYVPGKTHATSAHRYHRPAPQDRRRDIDSGPVRRVAGFHKEKSSHPAVAPSSMAALAFHG